MISLQQETAVFLFYTSGCQQVTLTELTLDIPYPKGSIILCTPSSTLFSDKEQTYLLKSVHAAVTTWNENFGFGYKNFSVTAQSNYLEFHRIIPYLPGYAWYNHDYFGQRLVVEHVSQEWDVLWTKFGISKDFSSSQNSFE